MMLNILRRKPEARSLRIAMIGTRGVPAAYGGFETAVEEIGSRLAAEGHHVTVYCRGAADPSQTSYLGMHLVHLPAISAKTLETLSHTFLSVLHAVTHRRPNVAFVFNSANAPFLPLLRLFGIPVAVHVDGLEWKRSKWGRMGKRYYQVAERLAVLWADALIADAQGIADYYQEKFRAQTEILAYGTKIIENSPADRLVELDLEPQGYHLVVARFEPENKVELIVQGYLKSDARFPLVVVGSAPYSAPYTRLIESLASGQPRVHVIGGIWDQQLLDQLYANAITYLHGHTVGGTNPSLLRAMGAGTPVLASNVVFNREVLAGLGRYFERSDEIASLIVEAERDVDARRAIGARLRQRAATLYDWVDVAAGYGELAERLYAARFRPGRRLRSGSTRVNHA